MKIILANGAELAPISAQGGKKAVQGANRDCLSFVFPVETSLDELDGIFTAENCETITIDDGENEYVHSAYTVRVELKRAPVEEHPETATEAAVYGSRVSVTMAQRTYVETLLMQMGASLV